MRFVFFNLAAFLHIFLMFLLFSSHTGWRRHGSLHYQNGLLRQVRASERGGRSSVSYPTSSVIPHNTPHFFFFFFLSLPSPSPHFLRVTALEAERLEESREERTRFLADLRAEVERQAKVKGVAVRLPPVEGERR